MISLNAIRAKAASTIETEILSAWLCLVFQMLIAPATLKAMAKMCNHEFKGLMLLSLLKRYCNYNILTYFVNSCIVGFCLYVIFIL